VVLLHCYLVGKILGLVSWMVIVVVDIWGLVACVSFRLLVRVTVALEDLSTDEENGA
jgi:hypothetical protein